MKATERKKRQGRTKQTLINEIDALQKSLKAEAEQAEFATKQADKWMCDYNVLRGNVRHMTAGGEPPFYWMIGYYGWGSAEDDVDFIDGTEFPTAQQAVDEWEQMRLRHGVRAYNQDNLDSQASTLLVYRIDEVGQATTDRRWVFKPKTDRVVDGF